MRSHLYCSGTFRLYKVEFSSKPFGVCRSRDGIEVIFDLKWNRIPNFRTKLEAPFQFINLLELPTNFVYLSLFNQISGDSLTDLIFIGAVQLTKTVHIILSQCFQSFQKSYAHKREQTKMSTSSNDCQWLDRSLVVSTKKMKMLNFSRNFCFFLLVFIFN